MKVTELRAAAARDAIGRRLKATAAALISHDVYDQCSSVEKKNVDSSASRMSARQKYA